jgi:hypothetical protein
MPKSKTLPSFVSERGLIALRYLAPFRFSLSGVAAAAVFALSGCAGTREVAIDYPETEAAELRALPGTATVQGDDFYVQLISEFEFARDANHGMRCRDLGVNYKKGGASAALLFQIRNDALKLYREVPALVYQTAAGECSFTFNAKKVYLTPWMRLDTAEDTQIDFSFVNSLNSDIDFAKLASDVGAASGMLVLTGAGAGVALMGQIASGWMLGNETWSAQQPQQDSSGNQSRRETHSLPAVVALNNQGGVVNKIRFAIREVSDKPVSFLGSDAKVLGEVSVRGVLRPSLLMKINPEGLPDARDLSLEELWRSKMQGASADGTLLSYITEAEHPERPNLQPNWADYKDVESNCRKLKVVMKDLGFNKFDRNAVLYYFLDKSADWKNYNLPGQQILSGGISHSQLQQYRAKSFGGCLVSEDYETMKKMGLPVNSEEDWRGILGQTQEKESYFSAVRSVERQLVSAMTNSDPAVAERQLFPLIATVEKGTGTVLLQNHLANFGLEQILNVAAVPGNGIVATAAQLAQVFSMLRIEVLSCARPAFEQGRSLKNSAIMLFTTKNGSPLVKGGALEFEFDGGKIKRIAFQHPAYRDYLQNLRDYPDLGGCKVDAALVERLN